MTDTNTIWHRLIEFSGKLVSFHLCWFIFRLLSIDLALAQRGTIESVLDDVVGDRYEQRLSVSDGLFSV